MKITGVEPKLLIVSTFVLDNVGLGTVRAGRATPDNTRSPHLTSPRGGRLDQTRLDQTTGCHLDWRPQILHFSSGHFTKAWLDGDWEVTGYSFHPWIINVFL